MVLGVALGGVVAIVVELLVLLAGAAGYFLRAAAGECPVAAGGHGLCAGRPGGRPGVCLPLAGPEAAGRPGCGPDLRGAAVDHQCGPGRGTGAGGAWPGGVGLLPVRRSPGRAAVSAVRAKEAFQRPAQPRVRAWRNLAEGAISLCQNP